MEKLDTAVSLALAGLKLAPEQVTIVNEATTLDLLDLGLGFDDIEKVRANTRINDQRYVSQKTTFGESKKTLAQLLKEDFEEYMDIEEEEVTGDSFAGLTPEEVFGAGMATGEEEGMMVGEDELLPPSPVDYTSDPGGTAEMSRQQLHTIVQSAGEVQSKLSDADQLPEWCRSHIAQAEQLIDSVAEYLDYKTLSHEIQS